MSTISPDELITALEEGRSLYPLGIDDPLIDEMIADIHRTRLVLDSETDLANTLRQYVRPSLQFITSERRELLEVQDLFVLPYERCVAFSQLSPEGRGQIVVSAGMINLIASSIYDVSIQNLVPKSVLECDLVAYRQNLQYVLNVTTFLFRYRFYRYGETLPRFETVLGESTLKDLRLSVQGALTFLLLHELGHIELGHIEREHSRMSHYDMAVKQTLTDYQKQEAEADQFALESMVKEGDQVGALWMSQSLAFFVSLELLSGQENSSHPLAINRHYVSELQRNHRARHRIVETTPGIGEVLGKRFEELARNAPEVTVPLLETPREYCVTALTEIAHFLYDQGIDIRAILMTV